VVLCYGAHTVGVCWTRHTHRHLKSVALLDLVSMSVNLSNKSTLHSRLFSKTLYKYLNYKPDHLLALQFCTQEAGTC